MERIDNNVAIRQNSRPIVLYKEFVIVEPQRKQSQGNEFLEYLKEICTNINKIQGP